MKFQVLAICLLVASWARADLLTSITGAVGTLEAQHLPVDTNMVGRAVLEAVALTADPSSRILTAAQVEQLKKERDGLVFQFGLRITMTNSTALVTGVDSNSPAARAGLVVGDKLDLLDRAGLILFDAAPAKQLLRSSSNATIRLRANGSNDVTLVAEKIQRAALDLEESISKDIYYIRLNGIYAGTGPMVSSLLRAADVRKDAGAVLDLRGASGSDLTSVEELAGLFSPSGATLYSFRDRQDKVITEMGATNKSSLGLPFVVLVDESTSGAAEVLAAVLSGSTRGTIVVGTPTSGDPLIREAIALPAGDFLYVATKKLVVFDGTTYEGRSGIKPDIIVKTTSAPVAEYEPAADALDRRSTLDEERTDRQLRERVRGDEALRRGADLLIGLKALNIRGFGPSQNTAP